GFAAMAVIGMVMDFALPISISAAKTAFVANSAANNVSARLEINAIVIVLLPPGMLPGSCLILWKSQVGARVRARVMAQSVDQAMGGGSAGRSTSPSKAACGGQEDSSTRKSAGMTEAAEATAAVAQPSMPRQV